MVRKLRITDLPLVSHYSKVVNDYKVNQIDFSNSVIQFNDETNEVEWFFVMSNNHEYEPAFFFEKEEGIGVWEVIDIYCSNDNAYQDLEYYFWYICCCESGYNIIWMLNSYNDNKATLDNLLFFVEEYDETNCTDEFGELMISQKEKELLIETSGRYIKLSTLFLPIKFFGKYHPEMEKIEIDIPN